MSREIPATVLEAWKPVRLTWELNHDEFRITNPAWPAFPNTIKQDAVQSLGLSPDEINIEPYKLLLYEKDSFFKRHKDSEKAPGMIGSLVVCLPSKHEGGQVHLSHAGKDRVYATSPNSAFDLTALAWCSDVTHEIKEVTAGHRLVLTYNIIQKAGPGKSAGHMPRRRFSRWMTGYHGLAKLVYFLDHKYSQSSLTQNNLKGRDRAVFQVLQHVGLEAGYDILLGNVTKTDCFDVYEEDKEESIAFAHLCSPEGGRVAAVLDLSKEDIIGSDPYSNRSPDSIDKAFYTGNESMPAEYRYYDSAVVLIPRDQGADPCAMITRVLDHYLICSVGSEAQRYLFFLMDRILDSATGRDGSVPTAMKSWNAIRTKILAAVWELGNMPLYHKTIRSCAAGGTVPGDLVATLASFVNKLSSTQQPDWNERLGCLLDCPVGLTCLFKALSDFEKALDKQAFKNSFREWVALIRRAKFETKPRLTMEDHGFIKDLVTSFWSDHDWVKQQQVKSEPDEVILALADDILPGAEAVGQQILDAELPRLQLGPVNWWACPDGKVSAEFDRFRNLVISCLQHGFVAQATELLDQITQQPILEKETANRGIRVDGHVPNAAHHFVLALGDILNKYQAPFMESARGICEYLLRNYALAPLPVYPTRGDGWAYRSRACSDRCEYCKELDAFVVSPVLQTAKFKFWRTHFLQQLKGDIFTCPSQDGDYLAAIAAYEERVGALRRYTESFRHEHFLKIFGDKLYRELILLEGPLGSVVPDAPVVQQTAAE